MKRPAGESQVMATVPKRRKTPAKKGKGTAELYAKGQIFPDVFRTILRYQSDLLPVVSVASAVNYISVRLNSMYDFDNSNNLGNKQPLYYDSLLVSTGPFRQYKVDSWKTTITVYNQQSKPLSVYWTQAGDTAEGDTLNEVLDRPNVRQLILTPKGGSKDFGTITAPGSMQEIFGDIINPESAIGGVASNPTIVAYGTLFLANAGGTSSDLIDCFVRVTHDFNVQLSSIDASISV